MRLIDVEPLMKNGWTLQQTGKDNQLLQTKSLADVPVVPNISGDGAYFQKDFGLPRDELLCQFAEEALEVALAALKLRRAEIGINPTPVTPEKAFENLLEELADISLVLDCLGIGTPGDQLKILKTKDFKAARWEKRMKAGKSAEAKTDEQKEMERFLWLTTDIAKPSDAIAEIKITSAPYRYGCNTVHTGSGTMVSER